MKQTAKDIFTGILNSYSIIFFLDNKILASTIMLVSFFNFWAGFSGLLAVVIALIIGHSMHLDKQTLRSGLFTFNALLVGIGMGTFFDPGLVFFSLLALASLLTLLLSVSFVGWFGKYKLPFLSIPFVIAFWFIVLPSSHFENLGLTQRSIYWINEVYAVGGNNLLNFFVTIDNFKIHALLDIYLRSIGSVVFQNNVLAGLFIAIALLYSSRILFSLSIIGFLSAYFFAQFTGSEAASINYYNIGANYMMVAFAIGGYFIIPSKQSYLWTVLLIPLTSLVLLFFYKLLSYIQLPVFSLPFSFVTILFLYFLQMRTQVKSLILTPLQQNSPEKNLYTFSNNKDRLSGLYYLPLHLPLMGEWTVTQAHDGEITHKGDWGQAFDFMITDSDGKSYKNNGYALTDFLCYNKPVFAAADGYVETIIDSVEDNEIGQVNTVSNWGNSIVIRHATGLYTQLSHLKKGSFKVAKGDFVTKGDMLAQCGNSGRSPEPHVHFQVQGYPVVGSRTINYPFAYFFKQLTDNKEVLVQYDKPKMGDKIRSVTSEKFQYNAFNLLPDSTYSFKYTENNSVEKTVSWDTYTDAYNQKYLHCKLTNSVAYYVNDGYMFYFTAFYGDKTSLLYYFFLTGYKIFLGDTTKNRMDDSLALTMLQTPKFYTWINDFVAPFYNFVRVNYHSEITESEISLNKGIVIYSSEIVLNYLHKSKKISSSELIITENGIIAFTFTNEKTQLKASCINC